jgi:hypothetical protein
MPLPATHLGSLLLVLAVFTVISVCLFFVKEKKENE